MTPGVLFYGSPTRRHASDGRHFQVAAEFFEPQELVVDEGFERPNIERLYGRVRVGASLEMIGRNGRFRLPAGGLSCDDRWPECSRTWWMASTWMG